MSVRSHWRFQYPVKLIAKAAQERVAYHSDRVQWWENQRDEAEKAIKNTGIQVRQHQFTGGKDVEIVIDPTLAKRLAECNDKVEGHRTSRESFECWERILTRSGNLETLDLDVDDVRHFHL